MKEAAINETKPILPGLTLLEKIGEGGMSSVWKAEDRRSGLIVAVKILRSDLSANEENIRLFASESKAMETIDHEGIVKSYGLDSFDGKIYYVMEFVDGYSFADYLANRRNLSESECILICESVAKALDYAWNGFGVVHCDIKPDNLMINSEGIVKVMDLGLSRTFRFLKAGEIKASDHVMGTPAYISPEQIYGDVELDCRADIYSLAATLYHLATGHVLFETDNPEEAMRMHCDETKQANDPRTYVPGLSEGFCQLLEVMLVKNRDYRIRTWRDVFTMCRQIEEGVTFKARPSMEIASSSVRLATA